MHIPEINYANYLIRNSQSNYKNFRHSAQSSQFDLGQSFSRQECISYYISVQTMVYVRTWLLGRRNHENVSLWIKFISYY